LAENDLGQTLSGLKALAVSLLRPLPGEAVSFKISFYGIVGSEDIRRVNPAFPPVRRPRHGELLHEPQRWLDRLKGLGIAGQLAKRSPS
jgi:hypothetical protein